MERRRGREEGGGVEVARCGRSRLSRERGGDERVRRREVRASFSVEEGEGAVEVVSVDDERGGKSWVSERRG